MKLSALRFLNKRACAPTPARVLSSDEAFAALKAKREPFRGTFFAMYSSYLGGITTDPTFMTLPVDDHMCHRGHAVFDTTSVNDGKLYNMQRHVERLLRSAEAAKIRHSFDKEWIFSTVRATARASKERTSVIRMWISAGPGDFGIAPAKNGEPTFYCMVSTCFHMATDPLHEVTVPIDVVGMKEAPLGVTKSVCYLPNVLLHMTAQEQGGYYGIWFDPASGLVKEGPINTVIMVKDGVMSSPPPVDILPSCTARRMMEVGTQFMGAREAQYRPIRREELYDADELFLCGADTHFFPIETLDKRVIGNPQQSLKFFHDPQSLYRRITKFLLDESCGQQPLMGPAGGMDVEDLGL
jgi:branched-subunit amino acid aminotransferase/4-amino-4-deoxychorismate lyase